MSNKKRCQSSDSSSDSDTDQYEVEDIINERFYKGRLEYKIRWLGYGAEGDTWEPESSLKDCPAIFKAYKERKRREQEKLFKKPKRSSKAKKRRASDSISPIRNEIAMEDVYDSAPKTPERDEEDDSDNSSKKNKRSKNKEKSTPHTVGSDVACSSKSRAYQTGSVTASASSKKHKKDKSSKSSGSHRKKTDSSTVLRTDSGDEERTSSKDVQKKKDKSDRTASKKLKSITTSTKQASFATEKNVEASETTSPAAAVSLSNSPSTTTSNISTNFAAEKDKTAKEPSSAEIAEASVSPESPEKISESNNLSNATTAPAANISPEKETPRDKNDSSAASPNITTRLTAPEKTLNTTSHAQNSAAAPPQITITVQANQSTTASSIPLSSVAPVTTSTATAASVPQPIANPLASNIRGFPGEALLSRCRQTPPQSELVPISEILAKNPPIIKDEVSELSGYFSSANITLSATEESGSKLSGIVRESSANPQRSRSSSSSSFVQSVSTDRPGSSRQSIRNEPPSKNMPIVFEDPMLSRVVRESSTYPQQSSQSRSSSSSSLVQSVSADRPGSSRQSFRNEPPSKNTPFVFENPNMVHPPQTNTVITMPPFVFENERPFSSLEQPISGSPSSSSTAILHRCFDKDPTVFDYAHDTGINIHNVNCQKASYVLTKLWKLRCPQCTAKHLINDTTVEYGFCLFTAGFKHFFMVKLKNKFNELYCIDADQYRISCPTSYASFTALTKEYFESLGDLKIQIQEQIGVVYQCMQNGPLVAYHNGGSITDHTVFQRPEIHHAMTEITRLFYLELTLAIGEFMCKQIDTSCLHTFVMTYYENRNPRFSAVTKIGVENGYESFYASLIPKPTPQS